MSPPEFRAIVLAGERPEGNALSQALGLPAGVLAPLAGQSCIQRVLQALRDSRWVSGGTLSGPAARVLDQVPALQQLTAPGDYQWLAPSAGPAASAVAAAAALDTQPLLLTTGDHGLLTSTMVDAFCESALAASARPKAPDILVGLVPYDLVRDAFPQSRRTVLRFSDGAFCGSNLFAVMTGSGQAALRFWSDVEAHRKTPWKIVRRLGVLTLLRYVTRTLSTDRAFRALSRCAGCRVGWVRVTDPRAAVDIDSMADWQLACSLLESDAAGQTGPVDETTRGSGQVWRKP